MENAVAELARVVQLRAAVVVLEHEVLYGQSADVPEGDHVLDIGKARTDKFGNGTPLRSSMNCSKKDLEGS